MRIHRIDKTDIPKSEIRRILFSSVKSTDDLKILQLDILGETRTFRFPEVLELLTTGLALKIQQERRDPKEKIRSLIEELEARGQSVPDELKVKLGV